MKSLLFAFLIFALAKQSLEYQYDKPLVIKGSNGRNYEVTMSASRRMYEKHMPSKEQVFIIQHFYRPAATSYQTQQPYLHTQHALNNQQYNFQPNANQHNGIYAAQNHYNRFPAHADYRQQIATGHHQPHRQSALITPRAHEQQRIGAVPQSRALPPATQQQQQHKYYLEQPLLNNYLSYSNDVPKDFVHNLKNVSQSKAGQPDVYPYKQIIANPRQFTSANTVTKCDVSGRCEPLKPAQNTNNNKQVGLRARRFLPYSEIVMPQYPHN